MALLDTMPAPEIIDRFRGVLDFYAWCTLNICRSWPSRPNLARSPACALVGQQFSYINKQAATIDPAIMEQYDAMATGGAMTWKDWMNRLYVSGDFNLIETGPE